MSATELMGNVRQLVGPPWSEMLLVATAFLCGAIVGVERQRSEKPAGLRTLLLICVGSTVFTIASMSVPLGAAEPGRIAAQIVTGVGFLGAGAILRERYGVSGLTTAATVWSTSAVGIVVGAGFPVAGVALSLTILLALSVLKRIESSLVGPCRLVRVRVGYVVAGGKTRILLQRMLDEAPGPASITDERAGGGDEAELTLTCCVGHREHRAVLSGVAELIAVRRLEPIDNA